MQWQVDQHSGHQCQQHTATPEVDCNASERSEQAGEYIAIPLRSWKSYTVTPQTVTTLKLEEAK